MRLLVDCHVFDGKFQGTRTYLQGLYQHLIAHRDIEFYFAACDVDQLRHIFGQADNIRYVPLATRSSLGRLALEFPKIIRRYRIDWAHFQYVAPLRKCCKEIVTVHDLLFLDFPQYFPLAYRLKNRFFFRRSARRADLLLTVSPYSRDEIVRHFGIAPDRVAITPNGVLLPADTTVSGDVRQRYGLDKYILTVSRIEPRKNHQLLLRAFVELELAAKGYKLVIVGAEDLRNKAFSEALDALPPSVRDHVLMFQTSYPDLVSLYRHASLFVFPSFAEGFGIPPIEAVSLGCTTLCSNATAMADFDFLGDKLFDPHDLQELKDKMSYWLQHPNDNIRDEQRAVAGRYDWECIAENLYESLVVNSVCCRSINENLK